MDNEKEYEKSFYDIKEYGRKFHEKNQHRIRVGIWCVILVPIVFLALMFRMGSSKIIYLVLWIVSLFAISGYLLTVEYLDYSMQEKLKELGVNDDEELQGLLPDPEVVEKRLKAVKDAIMSDDEDDEE